MRPHPTPQKGIVKEGKIGLSSVRYKFWKMGQGSGLGLYGEKGWEHVHKAFGLENPGSA